MKLVLTLILSMAFLGVANAEQVFSNVSEKISFANVLKNMRDILEENKILPGENQQWPSLKAMNASYRKRTGKDMSKELQLQYELVAMVENAQIKGTLMTMHKSLFPAESYTFTSATQLEALNRKFDSIEMKLIGENPRKSQSATTGNH